MHSQWSMTIERGGSRTRHTDSILRTIAVVGDAWAWLVLREAVLYDVRRFGEFHERLGLPRSTLSARLSQLMNGGLLTRHTVTGADYVLTDAGQDFFGCLMVALRWGDRWRPLAEQPLRVTHLTCGNPMAAVLRCRACRDVLQARDVQVHQHGGTRAPPSSAGPRKRTPDLELLERIRPCSIAHTLTVTGDWWSSLLIREAFFGVRRFDELQRRLEIAPNVLSGRLRRLIELDVLEKLQYEAWPVRHEYRLTDKGHDLYQVPLAMATWGQRWLTPDGDPVLIHACGHGVAAALSCDRCGEDITRAEVMFRPNS